jgi:hypothetical protein
VRGRSTDDHVHRRLPQFHAVMTRDQRRDPMDGDAEEDVLDVEAQAASLASLKKGERSGSAAHAWTLSGQERVVRAQ